MTTLEYETLIFPPNLFYDLEEFKKFVKVKEEGWEDGLRNLLRLCERNDLFEYCSIIKKELDSKEYKTFVNLVCKVNGITVYSLKQRKPECKLTLTEINRTIEEVLRPQVKVTYIHKDI
jgi:hypothetical protein